MKEGDSVTTESKTLDTRSIWLLLLKGGGYWNTSEIGGEFGADSELVRRFINQMCSRGYLRTRKQPGRRLEYAVDRACKIPLGLAMGDLMDAGAIAQ